MLNREAISIRPATLADAALVTEYNIRLARETEGRELNRTKVDAGVAALLSDAMKGEYFLAEVGGKIVGQLMITREWSDWRNAWFWWIQSVYVDEGARGNGVFATLFRQVRNLAQADAGVCGIRLYVERENERAQEIYRRMGMEKSSYQFFESEF